MPDLNGFIGVTCDLVDKIYGSQPTNPAKPSNRAFRRVFRIHSDPNKGNVLPFVLRPESTGRGRITAVRPVGPVDAPLVSNLFPVDYVSTGQRPESGWTITGIETASECLDLLSNGTPGRVSTKGRRLCDTQG